MKKLVVGVFVVLVSLVLSGCDMFDQGITDVWYDENTTMINISYRVPKAETDDETGERPIEFIFLTAKSDNGVWFDVTELTSYNMDNMEIPYNLDIYGNLELRIVKKDENGDQTYATEPYSIHLNEPQYIYQFDAQFDSWNGVVHFNLGVNEMLVKSILIEKSSDGGLNWEEVLKEEIVFDPDKGFMGNFQYFEYEEGNYAFRLTAFDENESIIQEMNSWNEINVFYDNMNFEGSPVIDYVGANVDFMHRNVNIWWNARGDFEEVLIEKSTDLENYEEVGRVPRFAQSFNYTEEVDGVYFYRVSALLDGAIASEMTTETNVRVIEGAYIGYMDAWVQWDTQAINVSWDFQSEDVEEVLIERRVDDGEFELVDTFGSLKKMHTEEFLDPGTYQYRITLKDADGTVLDSLDTKELIIEQPQHVHHLSAWFNQSTGEIYFNFGLNQGYVSRYEIEKSSDGGLTWEAYVSEPLELRDDGSFVDSFVVYELEEGVYTYRISGFNQNDKLMGTANMYHEVIVDYQNLNFDEPTDMHHIDGNYNIYDESVNLWWSSQGLYETHVIEVSTDNLTFTEVARVPRVATFTQIKDLPDGEYFFRISAVSEDGTVLDSETTEHSIYVREGAQIGSINIHFDDYNQQMHVNWDILKDNVAIIRISRSELGSATTVVVGEYGPFKTTVLDDITESGTYQYTIELLDQDGNLIDTLDSYNYQINIE